MGVHSGRQIPGSLAGVSDARPISLLPAVGCAELLAWPKLAGCGRGPGGSVSPRTYCTYY